MISKHTRNHLLMRNATVVSESLHTPWAELEWTFLPSVHFFLLNFRNPGPGDDQPVCLSRAVCQHHPSTSLCMGGGNMYMVPSSVWQPILVCLYIRRLPALSTDNKALSLFKVTGHSDISTLELKWKAPSNLTANLLKLCSNLALLFSIKTFL